MFVVSSRGMLVNNEVMSRLAIKQSEFCCSISLAKSKESLPLYLLEVKSLVIGTRNLAILYMGVPMAEIIGRKAGHPSITFSGLLPDHKGLQVDYQLGVIYCTDPQ